jgi:hypothetical protein
MQVSIFQSNVNKWYFLMQKKLPSHYFTQNINLWSLKLVEKQAQRTIELIEEPL